MARVFYFEMATDTQASGKTGSGAALASWSLLLAISTLVSSEMTCLTALARSQPRVALLILVNGKEDWFESALLFSWRSSTARALLRPQRASTWATSPMAP